MVDCLDLPAATGVDDAQWERFQLDYLADDGPFRVEIKSRQIAWSWVTAAGAMADAILDGQGTIFVSINQDEAKEKVRYAREIYRNLRVGGLPKMVRDNEMMLELANGARLMSLPARPPRGKARMNVVLDEFAHVRDDRQIYGAAVPVTARGGRLRIGSSPLGASGLFWEIDTEKLRQYPGYTRRRTPWWDVAGFSLNVREGRRLALAMTTAQRVETFGNERIKAIYANMPEEDFQQEFECLYVDEATAWITWDEIKAVQDENLVCVLASGMDKALAAVSDFQQLVRRGQVEPFFAAGVDVGRTRNTTEIFLVGLATTGQLPLRLAITLDGVEFDDQLTVLTMVMKSLPCVTMLIDRNGIGANLAETMERRFPGKASGAAFTNESKRAWATDAKMLVQQRKAILPADREIGYQIHSIKRLVSPSKNLVFDTTRNEKHHADKFWAWALALAGHGATMAGARRVRVREY